MGASCAARRGSADLAEVPARTAPWAARGMGWKPDLPDRRDRVLALPLAKTVDLPPRRDLRPEEQFEIYDQGRLGSCTAQAVCAAFHFVQLKEGLPAFSGSRLFLYYNSRVAQCFLDVYLDSGASLRVTIQSVHKVGLCPETNWPYDDTHSASCCVQSGKFTKRPSPKCYEEAAKNTCKEYARVPQYLDHLRACINEGFPFVFGFKVKSSFMTKEVAATGKMVMPQSSDSSVGGHAVMCVGYDDDRKVFIVRNSWGDWGDKGYFYMPYQYMCDTSLVFDIWAVRFVEGQDFPSELQNQSQGGPDQEVIS